MELSHPGAAPFIVCGDNPLALRLAEMLTTQYERSVIAVIHPESNRWSRRIRELASVQVVTADVLDRAVFASLNLPHAEAIAFVATRPPHVDIDELVIRPRDQATALLVHRRAPVPPEEKR